MNLDELRKEINKIDEKLVKLLERRMEISLKVGQYKAERGIPVLNINREIEVLKKAINMLDNETLSKPLMQSYFEIMNGSKSLQSFNKINGYGLLGEKLSHSMSPKIHNSLFIKNCVGESYGLFEIEKENLGMFMDLVERYGIKGFNVTIPYKVDVIKYLDYMDEISQNIGSVNTVVVEKGKKIGYNTDYYGFEALLKSNNINVEGKDVIVLGSGGSSKTVEYYCLRNNAKSVKIVTRDKNGKGNKFVDYSDLEYMGYDIIINTTPVGMSPKVENTPIDENLVSKCETVVDIIYNPEETKLLSIAKKQGKNYCNGKTMLFKQAEKAQEIWGRL